MTPTAAVKVRAPQEVRSEDIRTQANAGHVRKVDQNGVYTVVEVQHPDGSHSRFRVPTRSMSDRIASEAAQPETTV